MKSKIVEIVTHYIVDVPNHWTDEQIVFHWDCTNAIKTKKSEEINIKVIDNETQQNENGELD